MKSLQDCLGELQDTRVLTTEISKALESSALEEARKLRDLALRAEELPVAYPSQNTGLLALLRRQRERRDRCFDDLERRWIRPAGASYFERISRFVGLLRIWPARELTKRRFLLANLPAGLAKKSGVGIREGWIPGNAIRERVRAVRMGRRVRYSRHVEIERRPADGRETHTPGFRKALGSHTRAAARMPPSRTRGQRTRLDHRRHPVAGSRARIGRGGRGAHPPRVDSIGASARNHRRQEIRA